MRKRIVSAAIALCLFTSGAFAATGLQKATAYLRSDISVVIDGSKQTFKDANGKTVYPISYNDTTYLPIRSIGGIMGKNVAWDESTKTITLGKESSVQNTTSQTIGQKNALEKAKSYLSFSAFSYSGLIAQLEYEKFSEADCKYAADNCGANWNEQAAKKAKSYMSLSSFSKEGLISQLEYEGFTHEQALYGASAVGY